MPAPSSPLIRKARASDTKLILAFIRDLAAYERLSHQVNATEAVLKAALFPRSGRAAAACLLGFVDKAPAGFAVFYPNFSTFVGRPGLFLEDIFVKPEFRRRGVGKALWTEVARIAAQTKCGRMDWLVLSWNRKAQRFYRSLGARYHPTWTLCRIDGENLERYGRDHTASQPKKASAKSRKRPPKRR